MTISPQTIAKLADGVSFLFNAGFRDVVADLAVGESVHWDARHLNILKCQLDSLIDLVIQNPEDSHFSLLDISIEEILSNVKDSKACSCGEDFICIDIDGKEYACHLFAPIACDPQKANESREINFTNHNLFCSDKCDKCLLKGICKRCAGMNYISTGNVAEPDAFQCKAFKIIFLANCKLQYLLATNKNDTNRIQLIEKITESLSVNKKD